MVERRDASMENGGPPDRILVIKLSALGDFVQALGPMAAIRAHHDKAHITLLTTAPYEALGRACGYFDEIMIDARPRIFDIKGWLDIRRRLNEGRFARVYDLQNNDRTGLYFRLLSPRPEWVGTACGASHRYRSKKGKEKSGQAFDRQVKMLAKAGIDNIGIDDLSWAKGTLSGNRALQKELAVPYVLLVPGSAPQHPEKRWPAAFYGEIACTLQRFGARPVIIGSRIETALAAEIIKACPQALDLTGKTDIEDLAVLGRRARFAIGNDTGPMHIIAPAGCPCLVLFSAVSDPARHAPKGAEVQSLQKPDIADITPHEVLARLPAYKFTL